GFRGNVGERAVAVVVIQDVGHPVISIGVPIGAETWFVLPAVPVVVKTPIHIAGDEEVELSVVVFIEESGARAPSAGGDSGPPGDVGERAVPIVVVERVAAIVGD